MVLTLLGITTLLNLLQSWKQPSGILKILVPNVRSDKEVH